MDELSNTAAGVLENGIDHAWQWFSLHAGQRMQAVNFFLVASAFLSAGYVSALHFEIPTVAAGIAVLGVAFSVAFYAFEVRIRELLKAGERALIPAQQKLADVTGMPEFKICEYVERPKYRYTSYNKIIKILYFSTATAFFVGAVQALHSAASPANTSGALHALLYRSEVIVGSIISLYLGQNLLARDRESLGWLQYVMATVLVLGGVFILLMNCVHSLR
jgi:hypothetical protein